MSVYSITPRWYCRGADRSNAQLRASLFVACRWSNYGLSYIVCVGRHLWCVVLTRRTGRYVPVGMRAGGGFRYSGRPEPGARGPEKARTEIWRGRWAVWPSACSLGAPGSRAICGCLTLSLRLRRPPTPPCIYPVSCHKADNNAATRPFKSST